AHSSRDTNAADSARRGSPNRRSEQRMPREAPSDLYGVPFGQPPPDVVIYPDRRERRNRTGAAVRQDPSHKRRSRRSTLGRARHPVTQLTHASDWVVHRNDGAVLV